MKAAGGGAILKKTDGEGETGLNIWYAEIERLRPRLDEALALLPPGRRDKALSFRREDDRLRSAAAGLLLSAVLGADAWASVRCGAQGKPYLPGGPGFSLSHSGPYAILAVDAGAVGADVESLRRFSPALARRCFRQEELDWACGQDARLTRLWTRKESVMKAAGAGLGLDARSFNVLEETCLAAGVLWHLESAALGESWVSAAAEHAFSVRLLAAEESRLFARP